ncbi:hypothetical protein ACFFQ5_24500 [Pseudomonas brassicacearum]|jgi:hypothetical protein|uniref:hypothetical protein n=1 Tax=Pseudomonas TaxID=286 RepID=UPI00025FF6A4|nr:MULTISPECIES: hypothetical protein [Pseudomonas]EIK64564.1 hypothetical protein PflQ8_2493 [Pseudomonas fluorescens Q8r1-96]KAB0528106.1 hypothetical protein F7R20_00885 [Pseudomonas brassicacearum subsp. brassicacearum]NJP59691.1 hypothetical protein [Pseudomonas brassicacearum]ROM86515.1 hypothetical protein BK655_08625 [Pseudomonas brassicacearum]SDP36229.1 hypothetical protein SAMN04490180_1110 [Pseudomonas brassicacearum]
MSILNGPRLNFWGGIRTDVSLPNNSPTIPYDGNDDWPLFDLTTSTLAPGAEPYTDDQLNNMINAPAGNYYTAGGWNHYGQHVVDMQNALISSQGIPGSINTTGDLVGQAVYLLGSVDPVTGQGPVSGPMMVDLDPTSSTTTQIFVGGLQIGGNDNIQLLIRSNTVCSSFDVAGRVLLPKKMDAPGSFHASGTFQLTFPLSSIVSWNQNSSGLRSIIQAPGATGIVLRFVMFEMCPTMTTEQLDADYAAGKYTPNPSIGRVIGTLAPAFADEPLNCQPGRQLVNQSTGNAGYADLGDTGYLSIDMVNVIPKETFRAVRDDITSPIGPNADYGTVTISAGTTTLTTLEPTSRFLFDYYVYGGIVDLPLTADQLQAVRTSALAINAPGKVAGTTLQATESTYRIYADQRNVYLEDYPNGLSVTLQVRYLGGAVPSTTEIGLQAIPAADPPTYKEPQYWDFLDYPDSLTVSAGQLSVSFPVTVKPGSAAQAGFVALTCTANGLDSSAYFTNFRKYAQTDFGIPKGTTITWPLMYPNVLRFHYLAFPAMSRYIPLNQPDAIMGAKNPILARTSDAYKGTTLFMPVVRSMSPCQRALLRAYLTGEPWQPPQ